MSKLWVHFLRLFCTIDVQRSKVCQNIVTILSVSSMPYHWCVDVKKIMSKSCIYICVLTYFPCITGQAVSKYFQHYYGLFHHHNYALQGVSCSSFLCMMNQIVVLQKSIILIVLIGSLLCDKIFSCEVLCIFDENRICIKPTSFCISLVNSTPCL